MQYLIAYTMTRKILTCLTPLRDNFLQTLLSVTYLGTSSSKSRTSSDSALQRPPQLKILAVIKYVTLCNVSFNTCVKMVLRGNLQETLHCLMQPLFSLMVKRRLDTWVNLLLARLCERETPASQPANQSILPKLCLQQLSSYNCGEGAKYFTVVIWSEYATYSKDCRVITRKITNI